MPYKNSFRVALCGLVSALSLVFLFLTGLFPFATYALPCLAGMMMIAIVVECGSKWAWTAYLAVSILAVFITPDREAALIFVFFFGYYPIVKAKLEKMKLKWLEFVLKFLLFNTAVLASFVVTVYLFHMTELLDEMGEFGKYSGIVLLVGGNLVFALYDFALTRVISTYVLWFRKKFLRRIK